MYLLLSVVCIFCLLRSGFASQTENPPSKEPAEKPAKWTVADDHKVLVQAINILRSIPEFKEVKLQENMFSDTDFQTVQQLLACIQADQPDLNQFNDLLCHEGDKPVTVNEKLKNILNAMLDSHIDGPRWLYLAESHLSILNYNLSLNYDHVTLFFIENKTDGKLPDPYELTVEKEETSADGSKKKSETKVNLYIYPGITLPGNLCLYTKKKPDENLLPDRKKTLPYQQRRIGSDGNKRTDSSPKSPPIKIKTVFMWIVGLGVVVGVIALIVYFAKKRQIETKQEF